jgi:hypothetical protein
MIVARRRLRIILHHAGGNKMSADLGISRGRLHQIKMGDSVGDRLQARIVNLIGEKWHKLFMFVPHGSYYSNSMQRRKYQSAIQNAKSIAGNTEGVRNVSGDK